MYVAFFLPCSIHTAWLSYATGLAALMTPAALDYTKHLEGLAALLAVLITALGAYCCPQSRLCRIGTSSHTQNVLSSFQPVTEKHIPPTRPECLFITAPQDKT